MLLKNTNLRRILFSLFTSLTLILSVNVTHASAIDTDYQQLKGRTTVSITNGQSLVRGENPSQQANVILDLPVFYDDADEVCPAGFDPNNSNCPKQDSNFKGDWRLEIGDEGDGANNSVGKFNIKIEKDGNNYSCGETSQKNPSSPEIFSLTKCDPLQVDSSNSFPTVVVYLNININNLPYVTNGQYYLRAIHLYEAGDGTQHDMISEPQLMSVSFPSPSLTISAGTGTTVSTEDNVDTVSIGDPDQDEDSIKNKTLTFTATNLIPTVNTELNGDGKNTYELSVGFTGFDDFKDPVKISISSDGSCSNATCTLENGLLTVTKTLTLDELGVSSYFTDSGAQGKNFSVRIKSPSIYDKDNSDQEGYLEKSFIIKEEGATTTPAPGDCTVAGFSIAKFAPDPPVFPGANIQLTVDKSDVGAFRYYINKTFTKSGLDPAASYSFKYCNAFPCTLDGLTIPEVTSDNTDLFKDTPKVTIIIVKDNDAINKKCEYPVDFALAPKPTPTPKPKGPPCQKIVVIDKDNGSEGPPIDYNPDDLPDAYRCVQVNSALGPIGTDSGEFISSLLGILLSISGVIALIMILRSGYQMMISTGNPEQIQEARERITSAIVGLLFIIFSLVILQVIGVDILKLPGFGGN